MELNSKEYQIYKKINFTKRYEVLSNKFQFEERLQYTNETVLKMIKDFGYTVKYINNNNFFKVEEREHGVKFYFHICLKYSNTELITGATDIKTDQFLTGSVFGRLYKLIKHAEGVDLEENLKMPKFRNYEDLQEILKEAFGIYEDFKKALIEEYRPA